MRNIYQPGSLNLWHWPMRSYIFYHLSMCDKWWHLLLMLIWLVYMFLMYIITYHIYPLISYEMSIWIFCWCYGNCVFWSKTIWVPFLKNAINRLKYKKAINLTWTLLNTNVNSNMSFICYFKTCKHLKSSKHQHFCGCPVPKDDLFILFFPSVGGWSAESVMLYIHVGDRSCTPDNPWSGIKLLMHQLTDSAVCKWLVPSACKPEMD